MKFNYFSCEIKCNNELKPGKYTLNKQAYLIKVRIHKLMNKFRSSEVNWIKNECVKFENHSVYLSNKYW